MILVCLCSLQDRYKGSVCADLLGIDSHSQVGYAAAALVRSHMNGLQQEAAWPSG